MAEPLTDAWIEALADAARGRTVSTGITLVLEYRVVDGPAWHLTVAHGEIRVDAGPAEAPDVSFQAERSTALAMADGSLDPLRAVIDGDLLLLGDPRTLVANRDVLDDLGDLFASC